MLSLEGLRNNLKRLLKGHVRYEELTFENRLKLVASAWSFRVRILNLGFLPYVFSEDGKLSYLNLSSDKNISRFNDYSIHVSREAPFYRRLQDSQFFKALQHNSPILFEGGSIYPGHYAGHEFKIWFSHVYLMCEQDSLLLEGGTNLYSFQKQVLRTTYDMTAPDFKISI